MFMDKLNDFLRKIRYLIRRYVYFDDTFVIKEDIGYILIEKYPNAWIKGPYSLIVHLSELPRLIKALKKIEAKCKKNGGCDNK